MLVPMVMAIVIVFALLFVGAFINGQISDTLEDSFGTSVSQIENRTSAQNDTILTMGNISGNWDTGIDLMQVTIIITILAGAIAAIFLFAR